MPDEIYCTECGVNQPHETVQGKRTCMVCGKEPGAKAPAPAERRTGRMSTPNKLSETDRADIIRLVAGGKAVAVLAEDFHVSTQTIRNVVNAGKKSPKTAPEPKKAKKGRKGRAPDEKSATGKPSGLRAMIEAAASAAARSEIDALREELRAFEEAFPARVREVIAGELR